MINFSWPTTETWLHILGTKHFSIHAEGKATLQLYTSASQLISQACSCYQMFHHGQCFCTSWIWRFTVLDTYLAIWDILDHGIKMSSVASASHSNLAADIAAELIKARGERERERVILLFLFLLLYIYVYIYRDMYKYILSSFLIICDYM